VGSRAIWDAAGVVAARSRLAQRSGAWADCGGRAGLEIGTEAMGALSYLELEIMRNAMGSACAGRAVLRPVMRGRCFFFVGRLAPVTLLASFCGAPDPWRVLVWFFLWGARSLAGAGLVLFVGRFAPVTLLASFCGALRPRPPDRWNPCRFPRTPSGNAGRHQLPRWFRMPRGERYAPASHNKQALFIAFCFARPLPALGTTKALASLDASCPSRPLPALGTTEVYSLFLLFAGRFAPVTLLASFCGALRPYASG
jgi:hypothetical protein